MFRVIAKITRWETTHNWIGSREVAIECAKQVAAENPKWPVVVKDHDNKEVWKTEKP